MQSIWNCALLAVIKEGNITSAKLVDKLKDVLCKQVSIGLKFGHGGTLDETATGVLVIGVGLGCKLLPSFLHGRKIYTVEATLGAETDTYNECGQVVAQKPFHHVTTGLIMEKLQGFQGRILQTPPKYSALKLHGRRASDWMRSGANVELIPRKVSCYSIKLLDFNGATMKLLVECGGGFYVRSLIHDLGQSLGTCAHVSKLHRNQHGFLSEKDSLPQSAFNSENLLENAKRISKKNEFKKMSRGLLKTAKGPDIWFDPT